ncbi:hypothetical protein GCM10018791_05040 [Streptomyces zaomyceticus]|nr:hypothetical protein GCM10018791_05040 [Streptomyces zaomyceticus]
MRTSMAMAWAPVGSGVVGALLGPRAEGGRTKVRSAGRSERSADRTDRAGEAAQVDVQARNEQRCARSLFAHVVGNHGHIVSIPGPGSGM